MNLPADYLIVHSQERARLYKIFEGDNYTWSKNSHLFSYCAEEIETVSISQVPISLIEKEWNLSQFSKSENNIMYKSINEDNDA